MSRGPIRKRIEVFGVFDVFVVGPLFWLVDFVCDKAAPFLAACFLVGSFVLLDIVLWKAATGP